MDEAFEDQNGVKYTYNKIRELMNGNPFTMELTKDDAECVKTAVNQGIDSHLEACNSPDRGDSYEWDGRRLNCKVSVESFPVLLRRLFESDDVEAMLLASDMIDVLKHED